MVLNSGWTAQSNDYFNWKYTFQGGRQDAITGFINFQRRDYNPRTYTWNTQDQLIIDGLDRYDFVTNNPINKVDPKGLQASAVPLPAPKIERINLAYEFASDGGLAGWGSYIKQKLHGYIYVKTIDEAIKDMESRLKTNDPCKVRKIRQLILSGHGAPLTLSPVGAGEIDLMVSNFTGPAPNPTLLKFLDKIGENLDYQARIDLIGCRVGAGQQGRDVVQSLVTFFNTKYGLDVTVSATIPSVAFGWFGLYDNDKGGSVRVIVGNARGITEMNYEHLYMLQ